MENEPNNPQLLPLKTTLQMGKYRVERQLASGGFGNTYEVTNVEFEERMALKEFFMKGVSERDDNNTTVSVSNALNKGQFEAQKDKFKKEARRLRKLHNPHIVQVHDLFEENGTAYYAMDFVDGESLSNRLKRTKKPLSEAETLKILDQVLDALAEVHAQGIWHLDLKPGNIMLGKDGVAKLIDFGASKQMSASEGYTTTTTALCYTPGFAPTEQTDQKMELIGPWTDLYALGATLYKLLTNNEPPTVSEMQEDNAFSYPATVSAKTRHLIRWMMTPRRQLRPQSVAEVRDFLKKPFAEPKADDSEDTVYGTKKPATKPQPPKPKPAPKPATGKMKWIAAAVAIVVVAAGLFFMLKPKGNRSQASILQNLVNNMVLVEGGTFTMGATSEQGSDANNDEKPAHQVTLASFSIGKYEVTQEEWQAVMGSNPSNFKGAKRPVERVSWNDCQEFIRKLNQLTGKRFRLPTEAEWEYAARGGNRSRGYKYAGGDNLGSVAWFKDNSSSQTYDVGQKSPNELGLYDMSGNVWEWCQDWYDSYSSSSQTNPTGPNSGSIRVLRGGSWRDGAGSCRSSLRFIITPSFRNGNLGLRLAL